MALPARRSPRLPQCGAEFAPVRRGHTPPTRPHRRLVIWKRRILQAERGGVLAEPGSEGARLRYTTIDAGVDVVCAAKRQRYPFVRAGTRAARRTLPGRGTHLIVSVLGGKKAHRTASEAGVPRQPRGSSGAHAMPPAALARCGHSRPGRYRCGIGFLRRAADTSSQVAMSIRQCLGKTRRRPQPPPSLINRGRQDVCDAPRHVPARRSRLAGSARR